MDTEAMDKSGSPGWMKALVVVAIIAAAGAIIFSQLPRGAFPTDLSRIGKGTPALVVARDDSFVNGAKVMELINSIRPEYSDHVYFLAAHLGQPDGRTFAHHHGMQDGSVVLFAGDGSPLATLHMPQSADDVRRLLAGAKNQ